MVQVSHMYSGRHGKSHVTCRIPPLTVTFSDDLEDHFCCFKPF